MRINNVINFTALKPEKLNDKKNVTFQGVENPSKLAKPSADLMKVYFTGTKPIWSNSDSTKKQSIMDFAEKYKDFLNISKTDMQAVESMVQRAKEKGFKPWPDDVPEMLLKPGDKLYRVNRDRSVALIVIGKKPLTEGFKMAGSHIDSPHIMLKAKPLQDASGGFAIFKTMVHGGIKAHQWTQRNLALVGKVVTNDGREIKVDIGNNPGDPVLMIPELAPHVDRDSSTPIGKAFPKEKLNPIVGLNIPEDESKKVSDQVAGILEEKYGITKDDLMNAQLALVPAQMARDVGLDRSMLSGYGHDDKSSAFCSMEGLLEACDKSGGVPERTIIAAAFSNEEIGSYNNHGAQSDDTRAMISEAIEFTTGNYNENLVRKAFKNSILLSADVSTAIDPMRPDAEEATNSAKLGYGPSVYKNGPLFSTPEASARFDSTQDGVQTQRFAFNQDKGGGGTIGNYLATQNNTDVIDTGIPVIGMHAPLELISKSDLYEHKESLKNYYLREIAF
ncbi:MAG: hypothetical protein AB1782_20080 [Cyanobacteriota bacterium]